jgi:hypothetical protein
MLPSGLMPAVPHPFNDCTISVFPTFPPACRPQTADPERNKHSGKQTKPTPHASSPFAAFLCDQAWMSFLFGILGWSSLGPPLAMNLRLRLGLLAVLYLFTLRFILRMGRYDTNCYTAFEALSEVSAN